MQKNKQYHAPLHKQILNAKKIEKSLICRNFISYTQ